MKVARETLLRTLLIESKETRGSPHFTRSVTRLSPLQLLYDRKIQSSDFVVAI